MHFAEIIKLQFEKLPYILMYFKLFTNSCCDCEYLKIHIFELRKKRIHVG